MHYVDATWGCSAQSIKDTVQLCTDDANVHQIHVCVHDIERPSKVKATEQVVAKLVATCISQFFHLRSLCERRCGLAELIKAK